MTEPRRITAAAREAQCLLDNAPEWLEVNGLRVELAKCQPSMRRWLLQYVSPRFSTNSPLAELEALEERTLAEATAQLSVELITARWEDDAIEDALASLRLHLEEHFLQRKYARLYGC
ncbi:hypothetical protein [Halomonas sp. H5]|uniref:hypothetical protein n=1 Tax=Halomonas sp. H5 TaxID=3423910 RepID=UPI003D36DF53